MNKAAMAVCLVGVAGLWSGAQADDRRDRSRTQSYRAHRQSARQLLTRSGGLLPPITALRKRTGYLLHSISYRLHIAGL